MTLKYWVDMGTGFEASLRLTILLGSCVAWTAAKHDIRSKKTLDDSILMEVLEHRHS